MEQIETDGANLSAIVNAALRGDLERRRRQRALAVLLDALAAEHGPLDTAEDEAEVRRYLRLLGGAQDAREDSPRSGRAAHGALESEPPR